MGRRCNVSPLAIVAELADAHGSGPSTRKGVGVRVPSMAPRFLVSMRVPSFRSGFRQRALAELTPGNRLKFESFDGAVDFSFPPPGAHSSSSQVTHDLRRGLYSCAAS